LTAIVLLLLFAGFQVLPKFFIDKFVYFFVEAFLAVAGLPALRRIATAPTRHNLASLTLPSP
jgi:hypothetical protein